MCTRFLANRHEGTQVPTICHWNQLIDLVIMLRRSGQPTDPQCSATSCDRPRRGRAHFGMGIYSSILDATLPSSHRTFTLCVTIRAWNTSSASHISLLSHTNNFHTSSIDSSDFSAILRLLHLKHSLPLSWWELNRALQLTCEQISVVFCCLPCLPLLASPECAVVFILWSLMDVQNHARNFVNLIKFHTVHSLILAFNLESV